MGLAAVAEAMLQQASKTATTARAVERAGETLRCDALARAERARYGWYLGTFFNCFSARALGEAYDTFLNCFLAAGSRHVTEKISQNKAQLNQESVINSFQKS